MSDNFLIPQFLDRQSLIEEAIAVLSFADKKLGHTRTEMDNQFNKATDKLGKLKQEQISFSPVLDVVQISSVNLHKKDTELSLFLQEKLRVNNFYHIKVPITLFPRSGWAFTRLECWLTFCPDDNNNTLCPVVHDIFPQDKMTTLVSFTDHLTIGLDETLSFTISSDQNAADLEESAANKRAEVAVKLSGGANLTFGPFSYTVRRSNIKSRGRGNVECFWRLEGKELIDEEEVSLGVVLMVPKERKQPVSVKGQVRASHDFQILSADIRKDWKSFFKDSISQFFDQGAPLYQVMVWDKVIIP